MDGVNEFTKEHYMRIIRKKRSEMVNRLFRDKLIILFAKLRDSAEAGRVCHLEVKFTIPQEYDIDYMEKILNDYFGDLGYTTINEPRKDYDVEVIITLS